MDLKCSSTKKMEKLLKQIKKKAPKLYDEIELQQLEIVKDPTLGYYLKGDLKDFKCHDFKFKNESIRICYAYYPEDNYVTFVYVGTRENFYDRLKRYLND
jgi:mRNA-degrading endonuclease RelE of RelBE toxin-antitoxin system